MTPTAETRINDLLARNETLLVDLHRLQLERQRLAGEVDEARRRLRDAQRELGATEVDVLTLVGLLDPGNIFAREARARIARRGGPVMAVATLLPMRSVEDGTSVELAPPSMRRGAAAERTSPMQKPTVGRQVWYWPPEWMRAAPDNACAATVASTLESRSITHPCTTLVLRYLLPSGEERVASGVFYSEVPRPGCWSWPAMSRDDVDPALYQEPEAPGEELTLP